MDTFGVGVIGLGTWGRTHLETYADHHAADLVAACDLDESRRREAQDRYGIDRVFSDYRELIERPEVDAVSVVTPDFTHTEIVLEAVRAGKAVLVEKPLATTLEDCDSIREALHRGPVPFMVDFHNRWSPGVAEIRRSVAERWIGEPQLARCRLCDTVFVPTNMLSWADRSSVLWFLGSHCIDTLRWVLGREVERVYAVTGSRVLRKRGIDTPDFYLCVLEFEGGVRAVLENNWILPESNPCLVEFELEVTGSGGRLQFDGSPGRLLRTDADGHEGVDTFIAPRVRDRTVGFATESIRHFVDCVATGEQPTVGFEEGREATRVLLGIERSARERRPVDL